MEQVPLLSKRTSESASRVNTADTTPRKTKRSKAKQPTEKLDELKLKDLGEIQDLFSFVSKSIFNKTIKIQNINKLTSVEFSKTIDFVYRNCFSYSNGDLMPVVKLLQDNCRHDYTNFSNVGLSCHVCGHFELT
jgi:hypothetical protein